ncbi:hypothetical protein ACFW9D_05110 [Streptomyces sp. NPDC059524]|uniref:hypothetical protein n=1 Tax=Streptomyces sp. NPDC059524 TaxID=3346856 RepID=UPI0036CC55E6
MAAERGAEGNPVDVAERRDVAVIAVAVSLLPVLGLLLFLMDRIEERFLGRPPRAPRHSRDRHLRLVHDAGSRPSGVRDQSGRAARLVDAA